MTPRPHRKTKQQNGSGAGQARGGFALGKGTIVTSKANVRPAFRCILRIRRRANGLRQIAYDVVPAWIWMTTAPATRVTRGASSRDENEGETCNPHKNDAIASNTIDVRHCNFCFAPSRHARSNALSAAADVFPTAGLLHRLTDARRCMQARPSVPSPEGCDGQCRKALGEPAVAGAPRLLRGRNSRRTFSGSPYRPLLAPLFCHTPP